MITAVAVMVAFFAVAIPITIVLRRLAVRSRTQRRRERWIRDLGRVSQHWLSGHTTEPL